MPKYPARKVQAREVIPDALAQRRLAIHELVEVIAIDRVRLLDVLVHLRVKLSAGLSACVALGR